MCGEKRSVTDKHKVFAYTGGSLELLLMEMKKFVQREGSLELELSEHRGLLGIWTWSGAPGGVRPGARVGVIRF